MALSPDEKKQLSDVAKAEGVDPDALLAEAERLARDDGKDGDGPPTRQGKGQGDQGPKLFMYLLPFVTVREVRQTFLGLTEAFPGDSQVASDWASAHPMAGSGASSPPEG